jgi:large subunit ribosomal protein L9e
MRQILKTDKVKIPEGVTVTSHARTVTVNGPRGKLSKTFKHVPVDIQILDGGKVVKIDSWFANRKQAACVKSVLSAIENLFTGVLKGYEYHMRLVYAHFPINVNIPGDKGAIEIRNFIGERRVRKIKMLDGVTIEKSDAMKDELVLKGNDLELVSLSAALIQQSCAAKKKDVRKFLDGIYVSERTNIVKE